MHGSMPNMDWPLRGFPPGQVPYFCFWNPMRYRRARSSCVEPGCRRPVVESNTTINSSRTGVLARFRAAQVRSPRGDVTGVLDIAKCLYDAVSRLERAAERGASVGKNDPGALLQQSVLAELGKAKGKTGKAAMAVSTSLVLGTCCLRLIPTWDSHRVQSLLVLATQESVSWKYSFKRLNLEDLPSSRLSQHLR